LCGLSLRPGRRPCCRSTRRAWARPLPATSAAPDERFRTAVREQFVTPADLGVLNAANVCPSSAPVLEAMYANTIYNSHEEIDRAVAAIKRYMTNGIASSAA
jgi:hypothetical protein